MRWLIVGSRLAVVPGAWILLVVLQFAWWFGSVGDRCVVASQELLAVAFVVIGACCVSPAMVSWTAFSTTRVRVLQASVAIVVLILASVSVFVVWVALRWLPNSLIPGGDVRTPDDVTIGQTASLSANIAFVGGISLSLIPLLGRPVGSAATVGVYIAVYATSSHVNLGYHQFCVASAPQLNVTGAVISFAIAFGVWLWTSGSTRISRAYLDPV